jgi:hypothetical protein
MSRLVLMEVAMKEELPELYDIYFGGQILLHYKEIYQSKQIHLLLSLELLQE